MRLRRRRGLHGIRYAPPRRGRFRAAERRRSWVRRVLVGVLVLVVLAVLAGAGGWYYLDYRLDHVPRLTIAHGLTVAPAGAPYDVLLIGTPSSSARAAGAASTTTTTTAASPSGPTGGGPTTTPAGAGGLVVARVVPADRAVELLALPMSLVVHVPGRAAGGAGEAGLGTLAGSPSLLVQAVVEDLHVPLAHVVEVAGSGVPGLVDALGGIYLDFPAALEDQASGLKVSSTGCQQVDGDVLTRLLSSPTPYYFAGGQWHQPAVATPLWQLPIEESVLAAMLLRGAPGFGNPIGQLELVREVGSALHVDSTWSASGLRSAGGALAGAAAADVGTEVLPTSTSPAGTTQLVDAASNAAISQFLALGVSAKAPAPAAPATVPWAPTPCTP